MSKKRIEIEGHIYYITTTIYGRLPLFITPSFVLPILDSLNFYKFKHQVKLLGYVIMPDHLHLLIWPYGISSISDFMRDFKKFTASRTVRQAEVENRQDLLVTFGKAGIETARAQNKVWQDSFWDKTIYTEKFLRQKLNYIHRNPIRAGLVDDIEAYPYSSYRNYVHDDQTLIEIDREWN
ncbi:REP-associated tyrosine transposase [Candidatus Leptofilum sp.]|uniref:REP-associated tyrosine transposase n=1 Tax=Candidatus Leptofilum sp. TaxID=3241576 RepID=UPI003B5B95D6